MTSVPHFSRIQTCDRRRSPRDDATNQALTVCRLALARDLTQDVMSARAQAAVGAFAASGRAEGLPPERVLSMLKKILGEVLGVGGHGSEIRKQLMRDAVDVAIRAYYADELASP